MLPIFLNSTSNSRNVQWKSYHRPLLQNLLLFCQIPNLPLLSQTLSLLLSLVVGRSDCLCAHQRSLKVVDSPGLALNHRGLLLMPGVQFVPVSFRVLEFWSSMRRVLEAPSTPLTPRLFLRVLRLAAPRRQQRRRPPGEDHWPPARVPSAESMAPHLRCAISYVSRGRWTCSIDFALLLVPVATLALRFIMHVAARGGYWAFGWVSECACMPLAKNRWRRVLLRIDVPRIMGIRSCSNR